MSNIRNFPGPEEENAGKRVNRTIRRRNIGRLYKVLLLLLIIAAVLIAYLIYEKTKVYESVTVLSKVVKLDAAGTTVTEFDGNILTYSKDGAGAVDSGGKLLWNQTFDMQNPMISLCGDTAAFADYGGSTIYMQKATGFEGTIRTDKPIRKIAVSQKGYVAAVLEDGDVMWIYMYDMNGTVIAYFRTTMEKSGYPVDLDISPSGELVMVSYYYVDINEVQSRVSFFNFGDVGQNNIDNLVSSYNYNDSLVPMVRFLDDDSAFAMSPERLSVYGGQHKPLSVADLFINDDPLAVFYGSDAIGIVYRNVSADNRYRLVIYSDEGKALSALEFDYDYTGVSFGNGNYILYGDSDIYIAGYNGEKKFEGKYGEAIRLAIPTSNPSRYIFVTADFIETVEFK